MTKDNSYCYTLDELKERWTVSKFCKSCANIAMAAQDIELPEGYEYDRRRDMIVKTKPKNDRLERQKKAHIRAYQKLLTR